MQLTQATPPFERLWHNTIRTHLRTALQQYLSRQPKVPFAAASTQGFHSDRDPPASRPCDSADDYRAHSSFVILLAKPRLRRYGTECREGSRFHAIGPDSSFRYRSTQNDTCKSGINPDHLPIQQYEICVKGHLDQRWSHWFEGLKIALKDNGETQLSGPVIDQAALYGLLIKVRDLGLPLVSVMPIQPEYTEHSDPGEHP